MWEAGVLGAQIMLLSFRNKATRFKPLANSNNWDGCVEKEQRCDVIRHGGTCRATGGFHCLGKAELYWNALAF